MDKDVRGLHRAVRTGSFHISSPCRTLKDVLISPERGKRTYVVSRLRRLLSIMHRIASLAAKLALTTAAGAGLYLSSHYTDGRRVSNWTTSVASSPEANDKQQPARDTNRSRQRLKAEPNSCDSQTWPNISPDCIAGRAEPAKVVESAPLTAEQPSSILLRPTKLPEAVPDPEVTGALPSGEQQLKVRDGEPPIGTMQEQP